MTNKLTLQDIGSGHNLATRYNANNDRLEEAFDNTISRDGTAPNSMEANLDMGGRRVVNAQDAVSESDLVTLGQLPVPSVELATLTQELVSDLTDPLGADEQAISLDADDINTLFNDEYIQVKRYKAVADGTQGNAAADTLAAQTALALAKERGGGRVVFNPGNYIIDSPLVPDVKNLDIIGDGATLTAGANLPASGAIFNSMSSDSGNQALLDAVYGTNVVLVRSGVTGSLENVRLRGLKLVAGANGGKGIWMTGFTRGCSLDQMILGAFTEYGIILNGSWSFNVHRCHMTGNGTNGVGLGMGITGLGSRDGAVVANAVSAIGNEITAYSTGVRWDFGSGLFWGGCTIEGNNSIGMTSQSGKAASIIGSYFENNGSTTTNNNGNMALGGTNGTDFAIAWLISGNTFTASSSGGHNIIMRGMQNCRIQTNRYSGTRTQPYFLTASTSAYRTDNVFEVPDLSSTYISNFSTELNASTNRWVTPLDNKPFNTQNGDYTFTVIDPARVTYKASGGAGETWTIPANASVPMPVGTVIEGINNGGGDLTLAITTDTLVGSTTVSTGTRFFLKKIATTTWIRSG